MVLPLQSENWLKQQRLDTSSFPACVYFAAIEIFYIYQSDIKYHEIFCAFIVMSQQIFYVQLRIYPRIPASKECRYGCHIDSCHSDQAAGETSMTIFDFFLLLGAVSVTLVALTLFGVAIGKIDV